MDLLKTTGTVLLSVAALVGQTTGTANRSAASYSGQTWVGLLVSASCSAGSAAARQSEMTVTDRVTTPAVDSAGTRGQSQALDASPADTTTTRHDVPQTGDLFTGKSGPDPAWAKAKRQARALGSGCKVDSNTLSFALLLPDGKMLRFDDLANSAIAKRMEAGKSATIYRVQVVGKLENGMVALDSIQM